METSLTYTDKTAWFSSDERKWIFRIRKLKEEHPDEVTIIRQPEENDGCIYCKVPAEWFRIAPKKVFSEEHLAKVTNSLNKINELRRNERSARENLEQEAASDGLDEYLSI